MVTAPQPERDRATRLDLETRLAENEQWLRVHRAQLLERDLFLQTQTTEIQRLGALEKELQAEVQRRVASEAALEKTLLVEIRRLAASERELFAATYRMGEREKTLQAEVQRLSELLPVEIQKRAAAERALAGEVQGRIIVEQMLRTELDSLRSSASWRLARRFARGAALMAPPGSRRRRVLQLGWRGADVLQHQGLKTFWRKVLGKMGWRKAGKP
jgi:hypothetical protein